MGLINVIKTANDIQKAKKFIASKEKDIEKAKALIEKLKSAAEFFEGLKADIEDVLSRIKKSIKELKALKEDK